MEARGCDQWTALSPVFICQPIKKAETMVVVRQFGKQTLQGLPIINPEFYSFGKKDSVPGGNKNPAL